MTEQSTRVSSPQVEYYFERFGLGPRRISSEPPDDLGMVIVIPCFNEPDLVGALRALESCEKPGCAFEIIVVVNSPEHASEVVLAQNAESGRKALDWAANHRETAVHLLDCPRLPRKKAGVGLARKIGMDEALRRLDLVQKLDGIIVCFDADCACDPNYLVEVERFFRANPGAPGCSIYFEHPLEGPELPRVYEAVTLYELHLRYYVEALRYAGFPHAFHTIGSSMAARARVYCAQGGMNKRQAGEDFYFLHKIIPLGGFGEINTTRVIASPRASDRVPFGTGRAVGAYLDSGRFQSYPLEPFEDLRGFFAQISALQQGAFPPVSPMLAEFLQEQGFDAQIDELRKNTASPGSFHKRFFRWFDGFLAMKYVHYGRDRAYGSAPVIEVARDLYQRRAGRAAEAADARELLLAFRVHQRERNT